MYYTNLKKCREFDGNGAGTKEAITHCQGYLETELFELDPDVIVIFGNEATNAVYDLFLSDELQNSLGIHPDMISDHPSDAKNVSYEALKIRVSGNNTAIIPSIHFSNFGHNLNRWVKPRRDDISDDLTPDEYWDRLVNTTTGFLQNK